MYKYFIFLQCSYIMTNLNNYIIYTTTSFVILVGLGLGLELGFGFGVNYLKYKNKINDEYEKMYKIIEITSGLDKDLYKRKISPKVVQKFCKIAKSKSINLNTITYEEFNLIYKTYTNYLIKKY